VSIRQARSRWRTLADKDECPVVDVLFSQETMNRLFDCFTFFNELDLLEVRLETLAPHVDFFVLAESPITYRADPKPLYFEQNKERFAKFLPKIRHIIVDDLPTEKGFDQNWQRETLQRAALERGLADARDEDIIMLSDLDEIPSPSKILEAIKLRGTLRVFHMRFFSYFANCESHPGNAYWVGTGMTEYRLAKGRFEYVLKKLPTHLRMRPNTSLRKKLSMRLKELSILLARGLRIRRIRNGGHHFSWLGGADKVLQKRGAISIHGGEVFPGDYLTDSGAEKVVTKAIARARPLDETMPSVLKNKKFDHLIAGFDAEAVT
jgi:beta-1,4-mannosyl-glycoprotein beta-1,4-N-acetylglucosaminyltransferase